MILKKSADVLRQKIEVDGVKGVTKQVLIGADDAAPNFIMRKFTVEPGGYTFHHTHDFEHEVYVLKGQGIAKSKVGEQKFYADDVMLVIPNEIHQFINTGDEELVFLCLIPKDSE